jgi:hypothetical protein
MPILRLPSRVNVTNAHRPRRRGIRARRGGNAGWWHMIKIAWLLERFRRPRRSSPSVRQIALTVVSAGLAIMVIRAVTRLVGRRSAGADVGTQDQAPETTPTEPTPGNDTVASEGALTDRVQSEMFRASDAPAPATESG